MVGSAACGGCGCSSLHYCIVSFLSQQLLKPGFRTALCSFPEGSSAKMNVSIQTVLVRPCFQHRYDLSALCSTRAPRVSSICFLSCKHSHSIFAQWPAILEADRPYNVFESRLALCCLGSMLASNASLIGPAVVWSFFSAFQVLLGQCPIRRHTLDAVAGDLVRSQRKSHDFNLLFQKMFT